MSGLGSILLGVGLVITLMVLALAWLYLSSYNHFSRESRKHLAMIGEDASMLDSDGIQIRDLNKNGKIDIYEDPRQPIEARVEDLLGQMTLEEKVGMMFQPMITFAGEGELVERHSSFMTPEPTSKQVLGRQIRHFNLVGNSSPRNMAKWYNRLQKMAERSRLGIPVTISSDPRHSGAMNLGAAIATEGFSRWPDPLGFGAINNAEMTEEFGDIARQEYLSIGLRSALHPMADLATEPRWARVSGTFGEDAESASRMTVAYINGFQGKKLGKDSVSCMVKHFPGGGPQKDGLDAHFPYGKEQVYPGNNFKYHLIPFERVFAETDVRQVMPYYGIPMGQTSENVGMSFNKEIVTDLLREKYKFDGVVCTDWMICETTKLFGLFRMMDSTSWGVEKLSPLERYDKALKAGVDQFGGQHQTERLLTLVEKGLLTEERINESVRRLLKLKFQLGLFDDPYVDEEQAALICGNESFREKGKEAQRQSCVLLKNSWLEGKKLLPLKPGVKVYCENIDKGLLREYGAEVVFAPDEAEIALLRLQTPSQKMGNGFLERMFHQGDLDFKSPEKERLLEIMDALPTVVDLYLDRGAVIPEIAERCGALMVNFNVPDDVVLDLLFGRSNFSGKLPIEMPSSMEAVRAQREDMPHDSKNPLYKVGAGLCYE
ncbi:MAG: glycoside hydrolase family 3 C-terminal domain-containing protein [Anaerolineaceae bacterium]|nr:glycoside hydrolase family 3 C-terminal domain-containing protein [Anaerolineaceae bacterium]